MLLIVRLIYEGEPEKVWDYLINNLRGRETKKIKPVFISQLKGKNYVSVIFNVEKIDHLVKFLVEQVGECEGIQDTQTLTLMKPVFLPIPKDRPAEQCRFSIFLKVEPRYYHDVYNELLDYKYGVHLFPTYISYSLGEFDIVLSVLADNLNTVKDFANEKLSNFKGITDCTSCQIERSELLGKMDSWRRLQRSLLHIPTWATKEIRKHYLYDYDLSIEDYCKLTGAMVHEL